jgi:hypothetical protein
MAVRPARRRTFEQITDPVALEVIACIGPHQINPVAGRADVVTVTYPVGSNTVLSMQPDGTITTAPAGTAGPYECAVLKPDRLVYAPLGANGTAYLLPYVDQIPND